jgi:hypothetical protein
MVLAVDRNPFLARLPGRQPQRRPQGHVDERVEAQRPVRQRPMQVDRRRDDGDLRQCNGHHG